MVEAAWILTLEGETLMKGKSGSHVMTDFDRYRPGLESAHHCQAQVNGQFALHFQKSGVVHIGTSI